VAGLLERLAVFALRQKPDVIPEYVRPHFESAKIFFDSQQRILRWELHLLGDVFKQMQLPLVLLKGSAYAAAGLNAGTGRVFNDIDILVPEPELERVKNTLIWHGWFAEKLDDYDRQYYERWMHELPPMQHIERHTSLDIHHNILPKTSVVCPDPEKLLDNIAPIPSTGLWMLKAEDMVLHSASHLFYGGEFENSLRDLHDLDLLLRQFSEQDAAFFDKLLQRAHELGLEAVLHDALRYTKIRFDTPGVEHIASRLPEKGRVMDFLFLRALMPDHPSCNDRWTGLARFFLYIRSHWLKMPLYLLIPHLLRKSWMRLTGKTAH